jgi:hypothetical protein
MRRGLEILGLRRAWTGERAEGPSIGVEGWSRTKVMDNDTRYEL